MLTAHIHTAAEVGAAVQQSVDELSTQFNEVSFFGPHLTDKRGALLSEIAGRYQDLYAMRTLQSNTIRGIANSMNSRMLAVC
ncbi:hypothetical protein P0D69_43480 [Paraburkholderia sediminicola]|uniref:hypothetical protein n=1 Tax=Paraburkholderia sediminicola TaxID=458836 RepID=UPI0038BAAE16